MDGRKDTPNIEVASPLKNYLSPLCTCVIRMNSETKYLKCTYLRISLRDNLAVTSGCSHAAVLAKAVGLGLQCGGTLTWSSALLGLIVFVWWSESMVDAAEALCAHRLGSARVAVEWVCARIRDIHIMTHKFEILSITKAMFKTKIIIIKRPRNHTSTHLHRINRVNTLS